MSLLYSVEKAERVGKAMEARGYSGKLFIYEDVQHPSAKGLVTLVVLAASSVFVYLFQGGIP